MNRDSLAEQAAAWVPPWERADPPRQTERHGEAATAEGPPDAAGSDAEPQDAAGSDAEPPDAAAADTGTTAGGRAARGLDEPAAREDAPPTVAATTDERDGRAPATTAPDEPAMAAMADAAASWTTDEPTAENVPAVTPDLHAVASPTAAVPGAEEVAPPPEAAVPGAEEVAPSTDAAVSGVEQVASPPEESVPDVEEVASPADAAVPGAEEVASADAGVPAAAVTGSESVVPVDADPLADPAELRSALEAILLVVDEPATEETLAQVLDQPVDRVVAALRELSGEYTAARRGFDLRRAAGGWRLYTRVEFARYVERFVLDGQQLRLTQAALETLAVVAYKQPVSRSRVSAIRGVNCDGVVRTLVTRGLIEECGTEPETGARLYATTRLFLEKLGMDSVTELPPLAPFLPDDVDEVADAQP